MTQSPVKPIRTDQDLKAALARIERVFDPEPGTPEADEADVLSVLIEIYERQRWPAKPVDPLVALRFHMDRLGLRPKDLVSQIGSQPRVSEVLRGKRPLTVANIARLSRDLGIPAEDLLGDPESAVA